MQTSLVSLISNHPQTRRTWSRVGDSPFQGPQKFQITRNVWHAYLQMSKIYFYFLPACWHIFSATVTFPFSLQRWFNLAVEIRPKDKLKGSWILVRLRTREEKQRSAHIIPISFFAFIYVNVCLVFTEPRPAHPPKRPPNPPPLLHTYTHPFPDDYPQTFTVVVGSSSCTINWIVSIVSTIVSRILSITYIDCTKYY